MVSTKELIARVKKFYRFSRQELSGIIVAVLVVGFVFSFRDWGEEQFDFILGLKNLIIVVVIAAVSLLVRVSTQKIYGLSQGQNPEFKVWWNGLAATLVIAFISVGRLPLALVGGSVSSFMIKQRLGEFRYGFSTWVMAVTAIWAILANLILAILFAIGAHYYPQNYIFSKGVIINLVMAFSAILPFPQQEGLALYFGSKNLFFIAIFLIILAAVLLLTKTAIGLILAIVIGTLIAIGYILVGSEK